MEDDESSSEDGDRFYVEDILSQEKFWIDDSMKVMKSNIIPDTDAFRATAMAEDCIKAVLGGTGGLFPFTIW